MPARALTAVAVLLALLATAVPALAQDDPPRGVPRDADYDGVGCEFREDWALAVVTGGAVVRWWPS